MSFGGYGAVEAEEDAVNYAWNNGVILFGAAGNDNNDNDITIRIFHLTI